MLGSGGRFRSTSGASFFDLPVKPATTCYVGLKKKGARNLLAPLPYLSRTRDKFESERVLQVVGVFMNAALAD